MGNVTGYASDGPTLQTLSTFWLLCRYQIWQTHPVSFLTLCLLSLNFLGDQKIKQWTGVVIIDYCLDSIYGWPIIIHPGFYIHSKYFPAPRHPLTVTSNDADRLLLGPFCGKPACQFIQVDPKKGARGVCSEAYLQRQTVVVGDVHSHPGHIACDGDTRSEIVIPLVLDVGGENHVLGVLDLDCLAVNGFDDEDKVGLEKIARLLVNACNW